MKICNNTLMILKWLSTLNGGIDIEPGNKLYSRSAIGSLCTVVEVEENFTSPFITSDLQRFLATVSLFDEPDFEFDDKSVQVMATNGKSKMTFYQAKKAVVNQPNKVPEPRTNISIKFHLKAEDFQKIFKAASVMNVSDIAVKASNGVITISALNTNTDTTDSMDIIIGEVDDPDFIAVHYFKKSYLKLLTEFSYDVEIYKDGLSKWMAVDSPFKQLDVYVVTAINNK